ncbi:UDP-2,3-diacylglucosamine diphosphatase [Rhizobium rhizogenes]|uniref:UDP-2,3-diacylglucosamine diphosphatase n=1 Tax=Rhizobium rhizogenes TaxID=359 RepID=UPI001574A9E3|nr:UDP-2,3-diacylglucosamine diphosphatase [Rhizobium rhizogenes]NTI24880.1 UDP-2,3-diacylglucosamine diphosphatase [Rhizobium rhizogenes]QTG08599.1 UDP-2,3-diacylglucosamine diphosphatase [Rhizobium rhizogenes]
MTDKLKVNALFISDIHAGAPEARLSDAVDFLNLIQPEKVFLVGDIVDIRVLKRKGSISVHDLRLLSDALLSFADIPVTYLPGNHDPEIESSKNCLPRNVDVRSEEEHITKTGERILVFHGHQVDTHVGTRMEIVLDIVCVTYTSFLRLQSALGRIFRFVGIDIDINIVGRLRYQFPVWSKHVSSFEERVFKYARHKGYSSVICGHIHVPKLRHSFHGSYYNTGDWVENRTALIETLDGEIVLITFDAIQKKIISISDCNSPILLN